MARTTPLAILLLLATPMVTASYKAQWPTKRSSNTDWGGDKYDKHCWQCHGAEGHGDGPSAAAMQVDVPGLRGISNADTRGGLINKVRQGSGPMPAYHENISRQDIRRIFLYLEGLDDPKGKPPRDEEEDEDQEVPENDAPVEEGNEPEPEGGE
jgi:mono/diheme cytochrome c family protein